MFKRGDAFFLKGEAHFHQGDYPAAVEAYQKAIDRGLHDHAVEKVYTHMGVAYTNLKQYEQAHESFQNALDRDPAYTDAWRNMGINYRRRGQPEKAEECYLKAISIDSNDHIALVNLGVLYMFQDKPAQAIDLFERAVRLYDQSGVYHGNLAQAYAMVERFTEADESLKRAISLGYENWEVINGRIEGLRTLAQRAATEHDTAWLPATCPACRAPTPPTRVEWTGYDTASCGSCGVNLVRR
jgi:superkiller protein 3